MENSPNKAKPIRELYIGLVHLVAAAFAIAGLTLLIVKASLEGTAWHVVSFTVYGTGLLLLYTFSTLYHWFNLSEKGMKFWRIMDHVMIYVLIAATYTPICLVALRGGWGWSLFGVVWGLAILGMLFSIFWLHAPRKIYTALYILLGWIVIIGLVPLVKSVPIGGLLWLVLGGIFYSIGGVIYAYKKPNPLPVTFGFHGIFHIFVVLGSICHFILIYGYVINL